MACILCYALNLKALIKVSKVSWTSQLSYEILRSSLERKFDKTNFISPKRTPPKSPGLLGLRSYCNLYTVEAGGQPHAVYFARQLHRTTQQSLGCINRQQEMVRVTLPHQSLHATRLSDGKLRHQKTARTDHLSGISWPMCLLSIAIHAILA